MFPRGGAAGLPADPGSLRVKPSPWLHRQPIECLKPRRKRHQPDQNLLLLQLIAPLNHHAAGGESSRSVRFTGQQPLKQS